MDSNKSQTQARFSLTAVLIEDHRAGGFTAYIAEFPEVISEGETKEEAYQNLLYAFKEILEFKKEEAESNGYMYSRDVVTQPLELELA